MADKKSSTVNDILGSVVTDAVKQQAAGVIMGMVSKFLEGLLARLFSGGTSTKDDAPEEDKPDLPPGSKPVIPSTDDDEEFTRIFSGLRLSIKGVKRDGGHLGAAQLEQIKLSGSGGVGANTKGDPAVPGDVVNLDVDPLDQSGKEIGPGSPELVQLLLDPQNPYDPAGSNDGQEGRMRIQYAVGGGDFAINGTRWQYACTGNFKVGRDFRGETIAVVSVFATNAQGKTFTSNAVRFRVKG